MFDIFDIVLFGALCFVIGISATILTVEVKHLESTEDIWKLFGNYIGHALAFEAVVSIIVFIAEIVFEFLGIV